MPTKQVRYAWEISLSVCDRHIHELQACSIRGMRVSWNACFTALETVLTGNQFKKLNTLLFLIKFTFKRDFKKY